jgi:hypothetical protein
MQFSKSILFGGFLAAFSLVAVAADNDTGKSGLSETATESYQIRNEKFGDLLRPRDANSANGTPIVLYSPEPWKCMTWKLHPVGAGEFCLQNHFTSKTFVTQTNSDLPALVQTGWSREAGERPRWRFTQLTDNVYKITDPKSDAALTAVEGKNGTVRVVLAPWQDHPEQKWRLEKIDPSSLTM